VLYCCIILFCSLGVHILRILCNPWCDVFVVPLLIRAVIASLISKSGFVDAFSSLRIFIAAVMGQIFPFWQQPKAATYRALSVLSIMVGTLMLLEGECLHRYSRVYFFVACAQYEFCCIMYCICIFMFWISRNSKTLMMALLWVYCLILFCCCVQVGMGCYSLGCSPKQSIQHRISGQARRKHQYSFPKVSALVFDCSNYAMHVQSFAILRAVKIVRLNL
jgi:hypothetical protein